MTPYKIISIILHPIFMPLIVLHLTFKSISAITFSISEQLPFIYLIIGLFTIVFPIIGTLFLILKGDVSSLEMSNNKERSKPLFFGLVFMLIGYYLLTNIFTYSHEIKPIYLGALLIITLSIIISKKWKISLHLLGVGGAVGVFLYLQQIYGGMLQIVLLFILLSGLLAHARLKEGAHNYEQVYAGFLLGIVTEYLFLLLY